LEENEMNKKILTMLLVFSMLFTIVLSGCKNEGAADTNSTTAGGSEGAATELPENLHAAYAAVTTSLAPWPIALVNSMQKVFDENGWTLDVYDGEGSPATQTEQINSIISDGEVDLVILFPADSEVGVTYVQQLNAAGIPVITLGSDVTGDGQSGVVCYVGPNQEELVSYGANYIKDTFGTEEELNYVILSGWEAQYDYVLREAAVNKFFEGTPYNQLAVKYCGASRDTALEEMNNLLTAHDDIDFVFALSDEFALGAIQAIDQAGRSDEITVVSMEAFSEGISAVEEGTLAVTVLMRGDKVVEKLAEVLQALTTGGSIDGYEQNSELVEITIDNASAMKAEY